LLGLVQLSDAERRSRKWMIRIIIYAYGALLLLGIVLFSKERWAVALVRFVVGYGLIVWYILYSRRARQRGGVSPAAARSNLGAMRRNVPGLIVGGTSCVLLGVTVMTLTRGGLTISKLVWGLLLAFFGVAMMIWAGFIRFRQPAGD